MFFGFSNRKQQPPPIDRRLSLAAVPVVNPGVRADHSRPGETLLKIQLQRGRGWMARFQPAVMERTVQLDELGSFVFGLIDGQTATQAIIEAFIARYRVNRREAELSCVDFLKSLASRYVISIVIR